ncbi:ferredoxin-type protein NapF [Zobellella endophytica]|uniref:Ferredoxin-type protein NapF n=1 Tax=Zobellella endophytica TaxID=2116700 RepID=A0A2P7RD61_9GAMM|nr:ferredoxin-type protein NapF [Zobellella endophytica]PSJ48102.1 ferredoxin-type protein NapF [Zobellella endophytica]
MTSEPDLSRRRWLKGGLAPARPENTLPWAKDWLRFTDGCTRCGDCLAACPERIIVQGDGGFPVLDFGRGECTFCGRCAETCGQDIFSATTERPWRQFAQIGASCLAYHGVHCRSCEDSCEPRAICFKPQLGAISRPELDRERCNGCGACVAGCPATAIKILTQEST